MLYAQYNLTITPLGYIYDIQLAGVVESNIYKTKNYTSEFSNPLQTELFEGEAAVDDGRE